MKRLAILVVGVALLIGMPWVSQAAEQTPQQTPVQQPDVVVPPSICSLGPTSPPSGDSSAFIVPSTPFPAGLGDIAVDSGNLKSFRLAVRAILHFAADVLPDNIATLLFGQGLTFCQQIQVILANLQVGSDLFEKLLDIQEAFLSLPLDARSSIPPLGEAEF